MTNLHKSYLAGHGFDITTHGLKTDYRSAVLPSALQGPENICLCWGFTAQSTIRSCQASQLIVVLFLGRLRPSKQLTSTKRGRPRQ